MPLLRDKFFPQNRIEPLTTITTYPLFYFFSEKRKVKGVKYKKSISNFSV